MQRAGRERPAHAVRVTRGQAAVCKGRAHAWRQERKASVLGCLGCRSVKERAERHSQAPGCFLDDMIGTQHEHRAYPECKERQGWTSAVQRGNPNKLVATASTSLKLDIRQPF